MNLLHIQSKNFQVGTFVLDPWASETQLETFRRISVSYTTLGPLDISPTGFLSQDFKELIPLVQIPRVGVMMWGTKQALAPLGEAQDWWYPSIGVTVTGVGVFAMATYFSLTQLNVVLLSFLMEKQFF